MCVCVCARTMPARWQGGGEGRSVYTEGQEVREPECHGANTDHLKDSQRAGESQLHGRQRDGSREKECDGVHLSPGLCVCVCEGLRALKPVHSLGKFYETENKRKRNNNKKKLHRSFPACTLCSVSSPSRSQAPDS